MRSHDLNRLLDEPGPERRPHSKYVFWKWPGAMRCRENGCLKARSRMPLRPPKRDRAVAWPVEPRIKASRPLGLRALTRRTLRVAMRLQSQCTSCGTRARA